MRRILVTSALPYANGSIHLGHLVEYIQTDIWVRFQKLQGNQVYYVCADDTHGTPIMLKAEDEGITPEDLIARMKVEHKEDFDNFFIEFDFYGSTNDAATREIANDIYDKLKNDAKLISQKPVEQFFDPKKRLFLPDRYVKGTCPKCKSDDQYGDSCEICGNTHAPTDLVNPYSVISGEEPIRKISNHYFFNLSDDRCTNFLKEWVSKPGRLQPEARNKVAEWFKDGFSDWDISRDAPYFGFEIPDAPGKYFYVWLDAPIGYFGTFKNLCDQKEIDFQSFVDATQSQSSQTELIHFIGKDILYFHALFFPALLQFSGYRTPTKIFAHGFLTVNGKKMSKSRGTFITAKNYLESNLNPEWLRYYYFSKLNSSMQDIDLNLDDFLSKVNGDLIGKFINIASRCAKFINQEFSNRIGPTKDHGILKKILSNKKAIAASYETREYSKAIRIIMSLADHVNQYIDQKKPWELIKEDRDSLLVVCSTALESFRILSLYLKPVLPQTCREIEKFFKIKPQLWRDIDCFFKSNHQISSYQHLMHRMTKKDMEKLTNQHANEKRTSPKSHGGESPPSPTQLDVMTEKLITIEEFTKIKLKVARIVKAEHVEGADKLIKLQLDVGQNKIKQVFAGIKSAYSIEELEGKFTIVVANLKPRKMRFGLSEGMVLAASNEKGDIFLISPEKGAKAGMEVK